MFCKQCGAAVPQNAVVCAKCASPAPVSSTPQTNQVSNSADKGGCLWVFLGWLLSGSFISLILFFVMRSETPNRAKSILIGYLIGLISGLIMTIGVIVFIVIGISQGWIDDWANLTRTLVG
ncbi:MAG: hypothetical protein FWC80_01285 [Firmicutes bacterium]|nr:hypothetical protein [Bacillota bacterium]